MRLPSVMDYLENFEVHKWDTGLVSPHRLFEAAWCRNFLSDVDFRRYNMVVRIPRMGLATPK